MKNFLSIRKQLVKDVYNKFKTNRLGKNYSKIKALICLELGAVFAFIFIRLKIKPNVITFFYILLILIATVLLASGQRNLIYLGIFIFFFKNSLDLIDGFIARITGETSEIGHKLDTWAGSISLICFQLALGLYVYSKSLNINYLYLTLIIVSLSAIDFKKHYLSLTSSKNNNKIYNYRNSLSKKYKKSPNLIFYYLFKILEILNYDGRSRYTDLILLLIIIENYQNQLILSNIVVYIWVLTNVAKFLYKGYKTYNIGK